MVLASHCNISCPKHSTDLYSLLVHHTLFQFLAIYWVLTKHLIHVCNFKKTTTRGRIYCVFLRNNLKFEGEKKQPSAHRFSPFTGSFSLNILTSWPFCAKFMCSLPGTELLSPVNSWTKCFTHFVFHALGKLTPILTHKFKEQHDTPVLSSSQEFPSKVHIRVSISQKQQHYADPNSGCIPELRTGPSIQ